MNDRMIAYCGITCSECDAYTTTQAGDMAALAALAAKWSKEFGQEMEAADVMCDGCLATTGRQIGYCHGCAIRQCAVPKKVETCAHCESYACDKVEAFSKPGTPHRKTLDEIWAGLHPSS